MIGRTIGSCESPMISQRAWCESAPAREWDPVPGAVRSVALLNSTRLKCSQAVETAHHPRSSRLIEPTSDVAAERASPEDELAPLEQLLVRIWREVLGRDVGVNDDFFELGGDSIQAAKITNRLQESVSAPLHPAAIFGAPTISRLAAHYREHLPHLFQGDTARRSGADDLLTTAEIERGRAHLATRNSGTDLTVDRRGARNRGAVFILSPPRAGSTLLRVMLAGHPALFSPPELYLLSFMGMRERRARLAGAAAFLREGLVRAVMELRRVGREQAEALVADDEALDLGTRDVYQRLQGWLGERRLVDKTPAYALNLRVLRRAEDEFEGSFFIHLVRHPLASNLSFSEIRADLATGDDRGELPASPHKRGELWWLVSQQNILAFLRTVPPERQLRLRYEDLVRAPEAHLRELCERMRIPFDPQMLEPYADPRGRMTDGLTEHSRMVGDQKFHRHAGIDAGAADRWRTTADAARLCEATWSIAEALGYPRESDEREEWEL